MDEELAASALTAAELLEPEFSLVNVLVLLILRNGPDNGYSLAFRIAQLTLGRVVVNPTTVYKALRRIEAAGFVWELEVEQPSRRRLYDITQSGRRYLDRDMRLLRRVIESFDRKF